MTAFVLVPKAKAFSTPIFTLTDKEEKKIEDEGGKNNDNK